MFNSSLLRISCLRYLIVLSCPTLGIICDSSVTVILWLTQEVKVEDLWNEWVYIAVAEIIMEDM